MALICNSRNTMKYLRFCLSSFHHAIAREYVQDNLVLRKFSPCANAPPQKQTSCWRHAIHLFPALNRCNFLPFQSNCSPISFSDSESSIFVEVCNGQSHIFQDIPIAIGPVKRRKPLFFWANFWCQGLTPPASQSVKLQVSRSDWAIGGLRVFFLVVNPC